MVEVDDEEPLFLQQDDEPYIPDVESYPEPDSFQLSESQSFNQDTSQLDAPLTLSLPLHYQLKIVYELCNKDSLLVLGQGLGLELITANVLHLLDIVSSSFQTLSTAGSLILIINGRDTQLADLQERMREIAVVDQLYQNLPRKPRKRLTLVNQESIDARLQMYNKGGLFAMSSRTAAVDLLQGTIPVGDVSGIVVLNAHTVSPDGPIAFALRLFRRSNKNGFIKCVSDQPISLLSNGGSTFSALSRTLKSLCLHRVSLWPRFHIEVSDCLRPSNILDGKAYKVTEVRVEMTSLMREVQVAIRECLKLCINEIKLNNKQLDLEDWDYESALFSSNFAMRIRMQLDGHWHRLSAKTRYMVTTDLPVFQQAVNDLVAVDSVSFYMALEEFRLLKNRVSAGGEIKKSYSQWLLHEDGNLLYESARERVFGKCKSILELQRSSVAGLEEQPKWYHLVKILKDQLKKPRRGPILIMCQSRRTMHQLRNILSSVVYDSENEPDFRPFMKKRIDQYTQWRYSLSCILKNMHAIKAELEENNQNNNSTNTAVRPHGGSSYSASSRPAKRRRQRGGASISQGSREPAEGVPIKSTEEIEADEVEEIMPGHLKGTIDQPIVIDENFTNEYLNEEETYQNKAVLQRVLGIDQLVIIRTYDENFALEEMNASDIILYEPDPGFVRKVEVALSSGYQSRVFFMYYANSVEEEGYLAAVRKEKDAFTSLIREKAAMPITIDAPEVATNNLLNDSTFSTRVAGGQREEKIHSIVVDFREFKSNLPSVLDMAGFTLVPKLLSVGDFILTPDICVERKSVQDLISSFKDGRLYQQCINMTKFYSKPTILIEFSESKSFAFSSFGRDNAEQSMLSHDGIQQKICILLQLFPRMRIIWSSSTRHTAEIFAALKRGRENPDPEHAVSLHVKNSTGESDNEVAISMLQCIPGMTPKNSYLVWKNIKSLEALADTKFAELKELVGEENARKMTTFLDTNMREPR